MDAHSDESARAAHERSLLLLNGLLKHYMQSLAAPGTSKRDAAIAARALGELARATRLFLGVKVTCPAQVCFVTNSARAIGEALEVEPLLDSMAHCLHACLECWTYEGEAQGVYAYSIIGALWSKARHELIARPSKELPLVTALEPGMLLDSAHDCVEVLAWRILQVSICCLAVRQNTDMSRLAYY